MTANPYPTGRPVVDVMAVLAAMQDQLDDLTAVVTAQQAILDELTAARARGDG